MCGGGESDSDVLSNLGRERTETERRFRENFFPGLEDIFQNGAQELNPLFDFERGTAAQARAPLRGSLLRRQAAAGVDPNSPQAIQNMTDFETGTARSFDDALRSAIQAKLLAKLRAAQIAGGSLRDPVQPIVAAGEV